MAGVCCAADLTATSISCTFPGGIPVGAMDPLVDAMDPLVGAMDPLVGAMDPWDFE